MADRKNFKIDVFQKNVVIEISPTIFSIPVILRAAYHFIDDARVIVNENKKNKIEVIFSPLKMTNKEELEELGYEFNIQLISSFLEEQESKNNSGIRDAIMKAALLPQSQIRSQSSSIKDKESSIENKEKNNC
jgi:His-Xaa-Ser system protein HxsD